MPHEKIQAYTREFCSKAVRGLDEKGNACASSYGK